MFIGEDRTADAYRENIFINHIVLVIDVFGP